MWISAARGSLRTGIHRRGDDLSATGIPRDIDVITPSEVEPRTTTAPDAQQIWQVAQEELRFQLARPGYETWLANAVLVARDGRTFTIGVPTRLARDWVTERYLAVIREILSGLLSTDCEVVITVDPAALPPPDEPAPLADAPEPIYGIVGESATDGSNATRLNPNFTFGTFVVGNSSRFAHAACRAVADAPGKAYNPLFLYGGVGLGKTHLMHAIGHAVREGHRRPPKVAYITSEKFMNEMIGSIQENRTSDFRMRYRTVDVLLIDDIQFLAGKDRTQEEFFHTFNALHEIQKQIVVSSDRPPKDIPTLEDRLRSRFEGGLMADIQPPDFETRLAILNTKLGAHRSLVPEDVCSFIAHKIQKNIRELEGALIRVLAHASINGRPVTLENAQTILRDVIPVADSNPVSIELIQETVASYFNIGVEEMKGKRRDKHIVFPRQVAMYIIREETESSLPVIGTAFGGRDHTTALHAIEKITDLVLEDARLQGDLRQIRRRLHER
ncbi:MAG: chromosomal replication initiator protein DnaA [Candidatus Dormibacteraeota bacterium]|uniref:Chromosomal replication initiator protein DnaA n=1 Tax=Candidatus Amunia macphersoniae TaxID=3127014 RepID=A0A934NA69_9BACT|nr:chromosomal replication initiator protein DnaA [Candidatus Dormibacteraeota bacterium]